MQVNFLGIFLLGTAFMQGDITVSNSPNSPHRKLSDLTEDVSVLKKEIKVVQEMKENFNEILKKISDNATQQSAVYEQLKSKNEMLASEVDNFKKLYEEASKKLLETANQQKQLTSENEALKTEISNLKNLCSNLPGQEQKIQNLDATVSQLQGKLNDEASKATDDVHTKIDELNKNLSLIKDTTDNLTMSRENIEKYLQDFYAETTDKFNRFTQENEQKAEQKQITDEEFKEISQKIENFLEKYQKLDTFNDILVSFQDDLSQLKDSNFSLNVSHEKLEKYFQTFSNQTNEQIKNIQKTEVEKDAYKSEAIKNQMSEFKKDLINKCENICQKVVNQTNDRLQNLVQQVQTKVDSIRSRTFSKHTILSGESLNSIAKRYSTSPEQILITNNIQSARDLRVGDTIIVPNNL